jgi:pSer/pThr/pTyr-binding forkhead associated (FHA) protein
MRGIFGFFVCFIEEVSVSKHVRILSIPTAGVTSPAPPSSHAPQTVPAPAAPTTSTPPDVAPATDQPNAWLEGKTGALTDQCIMLVQANTMIGRSASCDLQIHDPKVSRKHFSIRFGNSAFFLQDQDSSGGTYINGERVKAQRLNDGDRIDLGDTSLVFHVE